jgi:hypothetical protein
MVRAQLQRRGQDVLVTLCLSPFHHSIHILPGCCTSVVEVVRMVQVRIRSALVHSERVVGDKTACMDHVSAAGRHAHEQLRIHIRLCRLVQVHEAHRIGTAVARKHEDVGDPAQIRIPVVDERRIAPLERLDLHCVLESRLARSQALHSAVGFPVGQSGAVYLRISDFVSGSCSVHGHRARRELHSYIGNISTASGGHGAYPFGGEAPPFSVVPRSQA